MSLAGGSGEAHSHYLTHAAGAIAIGVAGGHYTHKQLRKADAAGAKIGPYGIAELWARDLRHNSRRGLIRRERPRGRPRQTADPHSAVCPR
jgi:hypothetical protein